MDDFKEKIPMIIAVIIAIGICVVAYFFMNKESIYYTQIDNTKIEKIANPNDNMKYEYTLTCYSKNGKGKEISFKTSRELREEAFLELEVMPLAGVRHWKEVQKENLPEKVKVHYSE